MPEAIVKNNSEYTLANLPDLAASLLSLGGTHKVWLFYGNLGAGKTPLIKEICQQLGVDERQMSSPTFSIINEYQSLLGNRIFHFDFYRLKNETEIMDLGVEEYFDTGDYCFVEWPERMGAMLPKQFFRISIDDKGTDTRTIQFENYGRKEK